MIQVNKRKIKQVSRACLLQGKTRSYIMEDTSRLINTHWTDPFSLVMDHGYLLRWQEGVGRPHKLHFDSFLLLAWALSMVGLASVPFCLLGKEVLF